MAQLTEIDFRGLFVMGLTNGKITGWQKKVEPAVAYLRTSSAANVGITQFEKASTVAKLAAARKRKRECEGRCEGRKPLSSTRPEVVALARKLRRKRLSLRGVAKELAARGYLNERGKPYAAMSGLLLSKGSLFSSCEAQTS